MNYRIVEDSETDELGVNGEIVLDLLKEHKKSLYQQLKSENKLVEQIREWENDYNSQMLSLILLGLNQSEAREIAWPEIAARFGI